LQTELNEQSKVRGRPNGLLHGREEAWFRLATHRNVLKDYGVSKKRQRFLVDCVTAPLSHKYNICGNPLGKRLHFRREATGGVRGLSSVGGVG
jgi:hypothetical protein